MPQLPKFLRGRAIEEGAVSKIDPVILLLTFLLIFLIFAAFAAEVFFKADAVFYQSIGGLMTTVMGALMMRVKPTREDHSADVVPTTASQTPPATTTTVETTTKRDHPPATVVTTVEKTEMSKTE